MKVSAGILITNGKELLVCHVTNTKRYDIPKGEISENEDIIQTCIRETFEETNVIVDRKKLIDLGEFSYLSSKRLHLFLYQLDELPNTENMVCTSYFEFYGKEFPEVDGFKYVKYTDLKRYVSKNLFNCLQNVLQKYERRG